MNFGTFKVFTFTSAVTVSFLVSLPVTVFCTLLVSAAARRKTSLCRLLGLGVFSTDLGAGGVRMGWRVIGKSKNTLITQKGCVTHTQKRTEEKEEAVGMQQMTPAELEQMSPCTDTLRHTTSLSFSRSLTPSLSHLFCTLLASTGDRNSHRYTEQTPQVF